MTKKEELTEQNMQDLIKTELSYIGENPDRIGLQDTPRRVVKMWKEIFRGYDPAQHPAIKTFPNGQDGVFYNLMILDTGNFYSHCEHHMIPFFGNYWFGYIPDLKGKFLGLSKVARIVDYHAAKLQIQERLVNDIVEDLWNALSKGGVPPIGMGLVMKGEHLCKTMRGAKKRGQMTSIALKGCFLHESKQEFLTFIK